MKKLKNFELTALRFCHYFKIFLALEFFPGVSRQNEYDFWKAYEQLFKLIIN